MGGIRALRGRLRPLPLGGGGLPAALATTSPRRAAVWIALGSRVPVAGAAIATGLAVGSVSHSDLPSFDRAFDGWPLRGAWLAALSPLAHWDASWYLAIAGDGYTGPTEVHADLRPAFFPLFPLAVRAVAGFSSQPAALLISSYVVSLAAFAGALYLLYRLVELEVGRRHAPSALLLLALFPASLFFGIPHSESLFLLLSVGAFYAARLGRWPPAAALAAAASATRLSGALLLIPLLLIYLHGPREDRPPDAGAPRRLVRYRPRRDLAWLALAPTGLLAYVIYLALATGHGLAFVTVQHEVWRHEFAGPFGAVWKAVEPAIHDVGQLLDRLHGRPVVSAGGRPWWLDSLNLAFLAFAAVATAGAFRRLPAAYGAYALAALALPLSTPIPDDPLASISRYVAVLFPLFVWLAVFCDERRLTGKVLVVSTVLLLFLTVRFARWEFVG